MGKQASLIWFNSPGICRYSRVLCLGFLHTLNVRAAFKIEFHITPAPSWPRFYSSFHPQYWWNATRYQGILKWIQPKFQVGIRLRKKQTTLFLFQGSLWQKYPAQTWDLSKRLDDWIFGLKFYTLKLRKLRPFLLKKKQRKCINISYLSKLFVRI